MSRRRTTRRAWWARAAVLTVGTAALVAAAVMLAVAGLGASGGDERARQLVVAVVAAGAVAVVLPRARARLGAFADRLAGRGASDPEAALQRFTSRLGPPIPAEELLLQLAEALKATLQATRAEVWMVEVDRLECRVSVPHAGEGAGFVVRRRERQVLAKPDVYGTAWAQVWLPSLLDDRSACSLRVAPVVNEGEPLGLLVVERSVNDDFTMGEESVLAELARHLGLSLRNERLGVALEATLAEVRTANDELRASRARVVETADAERRRIERDLHDGAQQRLIALAIELRRVGDALTTDPAAAAARLDHASATVTEAIDELADLAHGIYPPVLLESGLGAALRVAARRHPGSVQVVVKGLGRHPAPVEAAVYFAVLEAIQNAAKHAAGANVTVNVAEQEDGLLFEVTDNGPGFDPDGVRPGHGLLNIGDRIGAIGGTVGWESSPGVGTRMHGAVPVSGRQANS